MAAAIAGDLSGATVDDGALTNGNWTVRTADAGNSFDAGRDWPDMLGHAGFTFDEGRSRAAEDTNGEAVITLTNERAFEPIRAHVTAAAENDLAFGQTPVLQPIEHVATPGDDGWLAGFHRHWNSNSAISSIDTWTIDDHSFSRGNQFNHDEPVLANAGLVQAAHTHEHTIDAGPSEVHTPGVLEASRNHGLGVASAIEHSQGPWTDGGHETKSGGANGHGVVGGSGAPDPQTSSIAEVVFGSGASGTRGLGDAFHFKDEISGLRGSDVVDHADPGFIPASISHPDIGAGTSVAHAPSGEMQAIELVSLEQQSADNFSIAPNQADGDIVLTKVPHDLIV
jgi:hypothetical protein